MNNDQIIELVKKLEPFFLGFSAEERSLKNTNGMELRFFCDWKGKTIVSGLHANKKHSIGCSFDKSHEKIFKDIRKRLMPEYYTDFFEAKREKIERSEREIENKQKLRALASVINGTIERDNHRGDEFVESSDVSIHQTYYGKYDFKICLNYVDSMKLAQLLNEILYLKKEKDLN